MAFSSSSLQALQMPDDFMSLVNKHACISWAEDEAVSPEGVQLSAEVGSSLKVLLLHCQLLCLLQLPDLT